MPEGPKYEPTPPDVTDLFAFHKVGTVIPSPPDPRDRPFVPRMTQPVALPRAFRLPALPVKNQLDEGSCGSFGSIRILEGELARQGIVFDGSEEFQYAETRTRMGLPTCEDGGSDPRSAMSVLVDIGATTETLIPYKSRGLCWRPNAGDEAQAAATKAAEYIVSDGSDAGIKQMLFAGHRVAFCFTLFENWNPDANGVIPMPVGKVMGGHWITAEGWDDDFSDGGWWVQNQWGAGWGVNGACFIPYAVTRLSADKGGLWRDATYTIRINAPQPQPQPDPGPSPTPTPTPPPDPPPPADRYLEGLAAGFADRGAKDGATVQLWQGVYRDASTNPTYSATMRRYYGYVVRALDDVLKGVNEAQPAVQR